MQVSDTYLIGFLAVFSVYYLSILGLKNCGKNDKWVFMAYCYTV